METIARTLGWRPDCACYGVEVIENPPRKGRKESDAAYAERLSPWRERWQCLSPEYEKLPVVPCKALDPFCGSGTTGKEAERQGRDSTLIDLNPEYVELARRHIEGVSEIVVSIDGGGEQAMEQGLLIPRVRGAA